MMMMMMMIVANNSTGTVLPVPGMIPVESDGTEWCSGLVRSCCTVEVLYCYEYLVQYCGCTTQEYNAPYNHVDPVLNLRTPSLLPLTRYRYLYPPTLPTPHRKRTYIKYWYSTQYFV